MMQEVKNSPFKQLVFGGLIGSANSLFGGGGGMIAVPLLIKLGLKEKQAHATAILVILPVSFLSFLLYAYRGYFQANVLIPTAIGVTFGGMLGAKLLDKLPTFYVKIVFAVLQLVAGGFLFFARG